MKKHPALIILKALLEGYQVEGLVSEGDKPYTLQLGEDSDGRNKLCTIGHKMVDMDLEEVLLHLPIELGPFIDLCEKYPEEKLIQLTANMALNHSKHRS